MNRTIVRILLLLVLAAAIALGFTYREQLDVAVLEAWVASAGAAAPVLFIGVYALATVLFFPGSVLTLVGGALFGPAWGTLYNLTGATLGAVLAFIIARYLASNWVQARIEAGAGGRVERLFKGVEAEGWRFVAFTRLVPLFPFNLLNYALGLTRISLLHYTLASFVFMLPGALAYTYLGFAGREAVAGNEGMIRNGLIALALLALVTFLPRLVARLREKPMLTVEELKSRADAARGLILDVRTAADFIGEQGHIVSALNLPLEELAARLAELGDDPERPIAIVCRTDRRSAKAAALLARRGFSDARVVRGGMTAWLAEGWPVEGRSDATTEGAKV
ncbi:MAG: VTT domain-containing protein [Chromatiaceae bacterium]|nr:VTT domain-containing protein [Gammaproteobacteria bacterium]MCP5316265.1 VTT domain-containing protein [Chromatiaceae bacterium]